MEKVYFGFLLFAMIITIGTAAFEFFHCKAATCHEFYYGFKNSPHQKEYVNLCYATINSLQNISHKHGRCYDETTKKINSACILALAKTMMNCIQGLKTLSELQARYYCGYRLMENCARHLGLNGFPYTNKYEKPSSDN